MRGRQPPSEKKGCRIALLDVYRCTIHTTEVRNSCKKKHKMFFLREFIVSICKYDNQCLSLAFLGRASLARSDESVSLNQHLMQHFNNRLQLLSNEAKFCILAWRVAEMSTRFCRREPSYTSLPITWLIGRSAMPDANGDSTDLRADGCAAGAVLSFVTLNVLRKQKSKTQHVAKKRIRNTPAPTRKNVENMHIHC